MNGSRPKVPRSRRADRRPRLTRVGCVPVLALPQGHVTLECMTGALCSARLRNGDRCRSVATHDEFCAYHAALADELGWDTVANGDHTKKRNARQRELVVDESELLELNPSRVEVHHRLCGRRWP